MNIGNTPRTLVCTIALALGSGAFLHAAESPAAEYRTVLDRYCVTCHNEKLKTAGLLLDKIDVDKIADGAPVWEKVARKLRTRSMPPAGAPRPDQDTYTAFASFLETALDSAAAAKPSPGNAAVRRLNRAEYTNAVRDLLAVEIDGSSLLPADDSGYGFDTNAEALSISPMLFERYVTAAEKISDIAVGNPAAEPATATYEAPKFLRQDDRVSEDLPFWSRGGLAVRHQFPLDGEYDLKIRLQRNIDGLIHGLDEGVEEPHQLQVRIDGEKIREFSIGGERKGRKRTKNNATADEGDPDIKNYEITADKDLKLRLSVKGGTRAIQVYFLRPEEPEGVYHAIHLRDLFLNTPLYKFGDPAVDTLTISGPYDAKGVGDTASRRRIFVCHPEGHSSNQEDACARKILAAQARRAYRRPVSNQDVAPLMALFDAGSKAGGFESGVRRALQGILVSPEFLFRVETDPANVAPGTAYRISDVDLASSLSFFLWSSIPDDQLLELASREKLSNREVFEQQARRMLADRRSQALVDNFAGQWLLLRNMDKVVPDAEIYQEFDDNLRQAFEQETKLFFQSMLREDRSVLDLLNADYTFLNERLARHYGIPNIHGSNFRRVTLTDENRKGLLGQGGLLTLTSYATRTSVVLRGKWLLENILGTPPPPPPANVPSLKDRGADGRILSVRQQMEQHRANAVCASCHARMDPLGFALENFDAIGKWRTTEGAANTPIDPSGTLIDGTKFQGPAGLRKMLLQQPEQFVTTVTEKLLSYAVGRNLEYYDAPAVRKIVREAASNDYRWSSVILGIVRSTPFQMRSVAGSAGFQPAQRKRAFKMDALPEATQAKNRSPQP